MNSNESAESLGYDWSDFPNEEDYNTICNMSMLYFNGESLTREEAVERIEITKIEDWDRYEVMLKDFLYWRKRSYGREKLDFSDFS